MRRVSFYSLCLLATCALALAQSGAGSGGGSSAGGGSVGGGGTGGGPTGTVTGTGTTRVPTTPTQRAPDFTRPIFLSGRVMTESGTPPPESAHIERVCGGQTYTEAYTNRKGDFNFVVGQNNQAFADASQSPSDNAFGSVSGRSSDPFGGGGGVGVNGTRQVTERDLWGCEIRAALPGYRSQSISLAGRRVMDNPDLGTIMIRKIGAIEGRSISMANETAPKDAKKAFQKGIDALRKGKQDEAEKSFDKALSIYPTYPQALYERGRLHLARDQREEARKDFAAALAVDAKLEQPYVQLTTLDYMEQKWDAALADSDKLLHLNPYDYPNVYMIRGIALMSSKQLDEAEKAVRDGLRQDMTNSFPGLNHVLGAVLTEKQDYKGAADALKEYLKRAPKANNLELVKKQLAELEQAISQSTPPPAPQP